MITSNPIPTLCMRSQTRLLYPSLLQTKTRGPQYFNAPRGKTCQFQQAVLLPVHSDILATAREPGIRIGGYLPKAGVLRTSTLKLPTPCSYLQPLLFDSSQIITRFLAFHNLTRSKLRSRRIWRVNSSSITADSLPKARPRDTGTESRRISDSVSHRRTNACSKR